MSSKLKTRVHYIFFFSALVELLITRRYMESAARESEGLVDTYGDNGVCIKPQR
jgi:hypothetical protein